jgi:hypothetical protein
MFLLVVITNQGNQVPVLNSPQVLSLQFGVNSIKPPLLVLNLSKTTTLHLRNKKPPHFSKFFAENTKHELTKN